MLNFRKLRQLRRLKDLTLDEMSVRVGYLSANSLWKVERGLVDVPLSRLEKIAAILDVTLEELTMPEPPIIPL